MVIRSILAALALCLSAAATAVDLNPPQLDPKYGEGCWVLFFDEPDFARPLGRLAGAVYINSITGPGLIGEMNEEEFFRRARSVQVGPEARLIAYAEPGFRKEVFALEPQQEVEDLRELGFPKGIASLKILCEYR
jgi:hypothetical protein